MLAFPAERPRRRPRLEHELVGFLESLPVVGRLGVVGDAFAAGTAHPAGHEPAPRDQVDGRQRLGQPQRIVPDRDHVAEQDDLGLFGLTGQNRRFDVHDPAHAERRRVMLVEHQHVEAHLLGVELFVEIAVVKVGPEHRVIAPIAHHQVQHVDPALHQVRVLIRPLGEVADLHACAPLCSAACAAMSSASRSGSSRST